MRDSLDKTLCTLTNNHCAGYLYDGNYAAPDGGHVDVTTLSMIQPSPSDGGDLDDAYGTVKRAIALQFGTDSDQDNQVDCSIAQVSVNDAWTTILDLHAGPFPFAAESEYGIGSAIYKSGRTTGNTPPPAAAIIAMAAAANVAYGAGDNNVAMYTDQIMIQSASRFVQAGDSGAAIVAVIDGQYKVIGLHFASNDEGTYSLANHIENVATLLNIEAWNGNVVVPYAVDGAIDVQGVEFVRVGNTTNPVTHTPD